MKYKIIFITLISNIILINNSYSSEVHKNNENVTKKKNINIIPFGTLIPAKLINGAEFTTDSSNVPLLARISNFEVNKKLYLENCFIIFNSQLIPSMKRVYGTAKEISCSDKNGNEKDIKANLFLMDNSKTNGLRGKILNHGSNFDVYQKDIEKNLNEREKDDMILEILSNKKDFIEISADSDIYMIVTK
jgi:hypothetical protein